MAHTGAAKFLTLGEDQHTFQEKGFFPKRPFDSGASMEFVRMINESTNVACR